MGSYEVRWTPPVPDRVQQSFKTMEEAVAFALTVVTPRTGSVDIRPPSGPTISVIATEPPRGR